MDLFELILNNLAITGVRSAQMEGEDCWVVPATILREGVLPGSKGPLFYPGKVNVASAPSWNMIPIVVNHPQNQAGQFISAKSPTVLEERGIGLVLNAKGTNEGALQIEAWIRKERARTIVPSLATALEKAEAGQTVTPINLSTGLFPTFVANGGDYNGRAYTATVSAMEPDHLAILMDKPGACSVTDGCGLGIIANNLVVNADASFEDIANALNKVIYDEISSSAYLEAIYPSYCIFSLSGRKYYRQDYTFANGTAKLSGVYTPVTRQVSYVPSITNNELGEGTTMSQQQPAACTCGGGQPQTAAAPVANAAPVTAPVAAAVQTAPVANQNPFDLLTPQQRMQISDSMAIAERVRSALVANVLANPNNRFTAEELGSMQTSTLEKMLALAPVANQASDPLLALFAHPAPAPAPVTNGNTAPVDNRGRGLDVAGAVVANQQQPTKRRPLGLPSSAPSVAQAN